MESDPPIPLSTPQTKVVVLNYGRAVPARRVAAVIRWSMLVVAILAMLLAALCVLNPVLEIGPWLGGGTLGTPFAPIDTVILDAPKNQNQGPFDRRYLPEALVYLAIFLITQWAFLAPRGEWRLRLSIAGAPSRRSALAAGFIGMLLSVGFLATLTELPDWWIHFTAQGQVNTVQHFSAVWVVMAVMWICWAAVFHRYQRSLDRYTAVRKIFRWLVAGTVLELLFAAPAHMLILIERGDDCYCERGTWTGVAFGCTAAFWLFGPGAILLFMRERRRREGLI
jgi:hypothetical protein